MSISKIELFNELIKLGVSQTDAARKVQELDNNDNSNTAPNNEINDGFTGFDGQVNDPNTAFLRAGARTNNDTLREAIDQVPDYSNAAFNALADMFANMGNSEQERVADQIWQEQKWWDRVDAKIKQKTRELKGDLKGIQESIKLAASN